MASKMVIIPGPVPVIEPVAYQSSISRCVYIPKTVKDGGGMYNEEGAFTPYDYSWVSDSTWSKGGYTPLYSGTVLSFMQEKKVTLA